MSARKSSPIETEAADEGKYDNCSERLIGSLPQDATDQQRRCQSYRLYLDMVPRFRRSCHCYTHLHRSAFAYACGGQLDGGRLDTFRSRKVRTVIIFASYRELIGSPTPVSIPASSTASTASEPVITSLQESASAASSLAMVSSAGAPTASAPASLAAVVALAQPSPAASATDLTDLGGELYVGQHGGRPGGQHGNSVDWYGATSTADSAAPSSTAGWSAADSASASGSSDMASQTGWYSAAGPSSVSMDSASPSTTWNDETTTRSRTKTRSSATSKPTGQVVAPSGSFTAPHYVIYADGTFCPRPRANIQSGSHRCPPRRSFRRSTASFWPSG